MTIMKTVNVHRNNGTYLSRKSASVKKTIPLLAVFAAFSPAFGQDLYVPSLYPTGTDPANWSIVAENEINPNSSVVSSATATIVTDPGLSIYNSANWYGAAGTTVSLPTGTLTAGATAVPWGGPVDVGPNQWLLITAVFDGGIDYMGYYDDGVSDPNKETKQVKVTSGGPPFTITGTVAGKLTSFTASGTTDTGFSANPPGGGNFDASWDSLPPGGIVTLNWERSGSPSHWDKHIYGGVIVVVPEPTTFALLGLALSLLAYEWRRRNAKA